MSDEEIMNIVYDHATAFSSCIQFSDDAILAFARDVLKAELGVETPEPINCDDESTEEAVPYLKHLTKVVDALKTA